jgi:hypothetical protein
VENNLPTQGSRIIAARECLFDALDPRAEPERELCRWLGSMLSVPGSLDVLLGMVERIRRAEQAAAYQKGFNAGAEHGIGGGQS